MTNKQKLKCWCSPDCQACACGWSIVCECEDIQKCDHQFFTYTKCEHEEPFCSKCGVKLSRWQLNFDGDEPLFIPEEEYCQFHQKKDEPKTGSKQGKIIFRFTCITCLKEIKKSELETVHQKIIQGSAFGLQCEECYQKEKNHEE